MPVPPSGWDPVSVIFSPHLHENTGRFLSRPARELFPMKHQYLGDTRDLFKYDLIETLLSTLPSLTQAFFIPMLTPDDGSGHGRRTGYFRTRAGNLNAGLADFLSKLRMRKSRDCFMVRDYFQEKSCEVSFYRARFTHRGRGAYFSRIAKKVHGLPHTLVFLDPDTGLEVASPGAGHLLYSEVSLIARSLGPGSLLMIYQHIPRTPRIAYIEHRCASLFEHTGILPSWISDGQVVFFFLCPEQNVGYELDRCLARYRMRYPLLLARQEEGAGFIHRR